MQPNRTTVLFVVGRHLFAGAIDHGNNRVLDVLNDGNTDLLRVHEVDIFPQSIGERIARLEEAVIPKAMVDCVLLCSGDHEAPMRRRNALIVKPRRVVFVLLQDHAIRGTLMVKDARDPGLVLTGAAPAFFPIIEPDLLGADATKPPIPVQVALVNKTKVSLITIEQRQLDTSR